MACVSQMQDKLNQIAAHVCRDSLVYSCRKEWISLLASSRLGGMMHCGVRHMHCGFKDSSVASDAHFLHETLRFIKRQTTRLPQKIACMRWAGGDNGESRECVGIEPWNNSQSWGYAMEWGRYKHFCESKAIVVFIHENSTTINIDLFSLFFMQHWWSCSACCIAD